jgi:protein-disulfide isomerase
MEQKISRRELAQLLALTLAGAGVWHILRKESPIGRDVSLNETAQSILQDKISPSWEVEQPTVTLVLFTDYRCPACKLSNVSMDSALEKDGHVRLIYRDWPIFGAMSEWTARVALASDRQGIYPLVHAHLMNERRGLDARVVREAVENSGGNWTQINADLQTYANEIDHQLDRNRQDAFQLGISGTPTYLAGPFLVAGAQDEAAFKRLFAKSRELSAG